ncbi:MAG: 3-deoxy-7-phosphoheptulonate synthase [Ignavibacteria bacterium]|nr:3-deoxy-7-phosphoheptulonate synthase [Ignavibacteria bacterium]
MLIVMKLDATKNHIECVKEKIIKLGFEPHEIPGVQRVAIGITGNKGKIEAEQFLLLEGVADAIPVSKPYKLVSREVKSENTIVKISPYEIGNKELSLIGGPCSVENREQVFTTANAIREMGVVFFRGGAYKPRSSPYAFQGLKEDGLELLKEVREKTGMKIVTEAKDTATLTLVAEVADIIQIGARNMQNYSLLEAAGELRKPILLKRGLSATIEELLMSAEYILHRGNYNVILCERGIRTFETATRNTLDLNAIPIIKKLSHLPVIVDPSHGIGLWEGVLPMSLAAIAAGADGLIIEVHHEPAVALSDGYQSLKPKRLHELITKLKLLAPVVGRSF